MMRRIKADRCRLLLIVFLFGFFAATLHANMHLQPDSPDCEFCSGHSSPMHAVVPVVFSVSVSPSPEAIVAIVQRPYASQSITSYRQRGPPRL
jgi:hypothetical protein